MHGVTGGFHIAKQLVGFVYRIGHLPHHGAFAQAREQAFFRARIPQALQVKPDLAAGYVEADVARGHAVEVLSLVENGKIVPKDQPFAGIFLLVHVPCQTEGEVGKKECVIQYQDIGGHETPTCFLEKTLAIQRSRLAPATA